MNEQTRIINLDIKYLFVNLPMKDMTHAAKFWLNKNISYMELIEQTLHMLHTIMKRHLFQYNDKFFQPEKGIAMGYPISSTMAKVYLQYIEEKYVKQWLDIKEIKCIIRGMWIIL